jgi:O-acetyl-ADP-ribose deacetylase (regulator of RNase III)
VRRAFPENFAFYQAACARGEVAPGRMLVFETARLDGPRYIINFPTKRHWRARSLIEDIDAGLEALTHEVSARDIRSIALPALGCGNGGLRWNDVRPRIEQAFAALPEVRLTLLPPGR